MAQQTGSSSKAADPAIIGTHTGNNTGVGVEGVSDDGPGVYGHSTKGRGVVAHSVDDYGLISHSDKSAGIHADSTAGRGIEGLSTAQEGVLGQSATANGVWGDALQNGIGVAGTSDTGIGVKGSSKGIGVLGESTEFEGVRGVAQHVDHGAVVALHNGGGIALYARSDGGVGVRAEANSATAAALVAVQLQGDSQQPALYAKHAGNRLAAVFDGSMVVSGDVSLGGADCAEDFDIIADECTEPGTVMVLDRNGALSESSRAYDTRVAGVLAGAGTYRPAIILDRSDRPNRRALALVGKTFCKVDAQFGAIEVGDLLTTSDRPGCAMRVSDRSRATGAIIGKALQPHDANIGLIPILVALQ